MMWISDIFARCDFHEFEMSQGLAHQLRDIELSATTVTAADPIIAGGGANNRHGLCWNEIKSP